MELLILALVIFVLTIGVWIAFSRNRYDIKNDEYEIRDRKKIDHLIANSTLIHTGYRDDQKYCLLVKYPEKSFWELDESVPNKASLRKVDRSYAQRLYPNSPSFKTV